MESSTWSRFGSSRQACSQVYRPDFLLLPLSTCHHFPDDIPAVLLSPPRASHRILEISREDLFHGRTGTSAFAFGGRGRLLSLGALSRAEDGSQRRSALVGLVIASTFTAARQCVLIVAGRVLAAARSSKAENTSEAGRGWAA